MGTIKANLPTAAHRLVAWYLSNHRDMPWRQTGNPYAIWVSETMLQQTRVETVLPYYASFMQQFPTITDLAAAEADVVLKAWQGLGYYSRARNLHKAARAVVELHGGVIPTDTEAFRNLPGVGPYTLGAVFSIAYNRPIPAVDGNVLRVMARFLGIRSPIESTAVKRIISDRVEGWLQEAEPRHLTQALMELGATVCTPRSPGCLVCPIREDCVAYAAGLTAELPVRLPKRARKTIRVLALWCEQDGAVLVQQRPSEGLLASMWQLPNVELPAGGAEDTEGPLGALLASLFTEPPAAEAVRETAETSFVPVAEEKHVFTHIEWLVTVYRPLGRQPQRLAPGAGLWKDQDSLKELPLPRVYEKLFEHLLQPDARKSREAVSDYR